MKEQIKITVNWNDDQRSVTLTNKDGHTYSSRSEELMDFLTLNKEPNTAAPVKTLNLHECKEKVAKEHKLRTWSNLFLVSSKYEIAEFYTEAALMYANQPKAPVNMITDEELRSHANKIYNQWSESDGLSVYDCMVEMAEWMRKQLT